MALVVNTNTTSTIVQGNLNTATNSLNKSIERLSTGYKINHASDDAAGLAIAKGFESQANGTLVAEDNTQHGINLLQTAEGDLDVIQDNLQRIRDLAVQAANGTYSTTEKTMMATEVNARIAEIDRIASVSKFSDINLLDGSAGTVLLQVGADTGSTNQLDISSVLTDSKAATLDSGLTSTNVNEKFKTSDGANEFIQNVDNAIKKVSTSRSNIGAYQNRLEATLTSLGVKYENMSSSLSTIQDTDVATEATKLTQSQILQNMSASLLSQANSNPAIALELI